MENCCEESVVTPTLTTKLVGTNLYITYNNKTSVINLNNLGLETGIPNDVNITVTQNGQTFFSNALPIGVLLTEIQYRGQTYRENVSYTLVNRDINWSGSFALEIGDVLTLKTWTNP